MLTSEQIAVLKADILAATDQPTVDAREAGQTGVLAEIYNRASSPAFYVWRTRLSVDDARNTIIASEGLAQLDNLTASKRDSLFWVFSGETNPSNATQRASIENLCGSQNALKAAIASAQKREATRAERLFATGTGTIASPGTLVFEGSVSDMDMTQALGA